MALSLQNEQKQHLNYILNQPVTVLKRFLANILANILGSITTDKEDNVCNDEEQVTRDATRALLKLLIDARTLRLGERDFSSQIKVLTGINDEFVEVLWNFLINETVIEQLITSDEYKFRDLEWRLEAKIASRFLHSQPPDPKIVLKFHLDREKSLNHRQILSDDAHEQSRKELVVQSNANNLLHIIDQLESARTAVSSKKGI